MRTIFLSFLLPIIALTAVANSQAQSFSGKGEAILTQWPDESGAPVLERYPFDLLPFIDVLKLDYTYRVEDGLPVMAFSVAWTPGQYGILNQKKVRYERLPDDVRIDALTLQADVMVDGEWKTNLIVSVDSLLLPPEPERFSFDASALNWETLFTDAAAEEARDYFVQGFTLENLQIDHIAFATFEPAPKRRTQTQQRRAETHRRPRQVRVYPVDLDIYIHIFGGLARSSRRATSRTVYDTPRGSARGRGIRASGEGTGDRTVSDNGGRRGGRTQDESTRRTASNDSDSENSSSGRKKKKKDDDEDTSLLPAALTAAAAVGAVAVVGGTVGYYGNTEAAFGLQGGFARPGGGAVLQAAVNEAVFGEGDADQHLIAKITGFYDALGNPLQPAIGLGAVVTAHGDDVDIAPTFSAGVVVQFDAVLLMGGYDVSANGFDFGIAYNFKFRR